MPAKICIGLLALCALLFNGTGLLAQTYSAYSQRHLELHDNQRAVVVAAHYAANLAPWDAVLKTRLAWALYLQSDTRAARARMVEALRLQPASADLWLKWSAIQLGCQECYSALAHAANRVNALAPQQMDAQNRQATLALEQWIYGDASTLHEWRQSLRTSLANTDETGFLKGLRAERISPAACAELITEMPLLAEKCGG